MIRTLVMITGIGFLVAVVCLTIAGSVASHDVAANGWRWPDGWHVDFDDDDEEHDAGAEATRQIAWPGGSTLAIDAPATIRYTQKAGPGTVRITGPREVIDDVAIHGGEIEMETSAHRARRVLIEVTAPAINRFDLANRSRLTVENYDQDRLELSLSGRASAEVQGRTRSFVLAMTGRGDADLARLTAADAKVAISGPGAATIAPTASANIGISGHGSVTMTTRPPNVVSDISGDGRLSQPDGAAPTPPNPPAKP
jgi:hypothetical protein